VTSLALSTLSKAQTAFVAPPPSWIDIAAALAPLADTTGSCVGQGLSTLPVVAQLKQDEGGVA